MSAPETMPPPSDIDTEDRNSADPVAVLPLRFTPFERLKWLDDRTDYPMTILVHVELGGRIDQDTFRAAVAEALRGHTFLCAKAEIRGNWPWWVEMESTNWSFQWHEQPISTQSERHAKLDVNRGYNLAVAVFVGAESSMIRLEFHHACTDGQGVRRFTYDLLSHYERLAMGDASLRRSAKFDALLQERLVRRHELAAPSEPEETAQQSNTEQPTTAWERIRNTLWFFTKRPAILLAPRNTRIAQPQQNKAHLALLDVEETKQIRSRALAEGVTFNDVAMSLLMRVLCDWNRECGNRSDAARARIVMPTDLRTKDDHRTPAANRMGYAFPSRTYQETRDWTTLVQSVHEETEYIKAHRLGADFVANITIAQAVPGLLPLFLAYSRCLATAALTNLGDVTRRFRRRFPKNEAGQMLVGGLPLLCSHVTPPVRRGTRAAFGMCICSDRLSVSLVTDPHYFNNELTERLLARYVAAIRSWIRDEPLPHVKVT